VRIIRWAVVPIALAAIAAWAQTPTANPGTISFVAKQMNVPIKGQFKQFSAQIQFDPARPAAGKAAVEIDVASLDLGDKEFNYEMNTKTWLDTRTYPKATFISSAIKAIAPDRLEVSGKLTIKGKTLDVAVPVTLKTEGRTRVFEGTLPIRRTMFNIGEDEWRDTSVVSDEVQIRFHLIAAPQ